jgi:hypothetical protein
MRFAGRGNRLGKCHVNQIALNLTHEKSIKTIFIHQGLVQ